MEQAGPLPPDLNRAGKVLASAWTPFPFTLFLIATRLYVRIARRRLGIDDYFMSIAWVLYLANLITLTVVANLGGFRHIEYLQPSAIASISKLNIASVTLGILCAFFAKSSVALLFPRLLGNTSRGLKYFLYLNIVLYAATSIANIATEYRQCVPLKALWEPQLIATGMGNCDGAKANQDVQYLQGAFGAYMDFLLAFIPIPVIFQLRLDWKTRIGVCCLLGLGVFAGACAIIKTIQFKLDNSTDPTWQFYALVLWATLELPLTIIAGCVPPSKPVYDALFKSQPIVDDKFRDRKVQKAPSIISLANLSNILDTIRGKRLHSGTGGGGSRDTVQSRDEEYAAGSGNNNANANTTSNNAANSTTDSITVQKTVTVEHSNSIPSSTPSVDHDATGWYQDPPANRK